MRTLFAVLICASGLGPVPCTQALASWDGIARPVWQNYLTVEAPDPGPQPPLEGLNPEPQRVHISTYIATRWIFPYTPGQDYWLERVEIIAGGVAGKVQFEILEDDGRGSGPAPILASSGFIQSAKHAWQGADVSPRVLLFRNHKYYLKWTMVPGGFVSAAGQGAKIPDQFSHDGDVWVGPQLRLPWIIRFFGVCDASAVEETGWGGVKRLYR